MKVTRVSVLSLSLFLVFALGAISFAEEMYILYTRDGSEIIVKDYHFTDELVEFTTGNDLPGFIKRENFAGITNMVGVPSTTEEEDTIPIKVIEKRELEIWIGTAAALIILYLLFLWYVTRKKRRKSVDGIPVPAGRIEKRAKTSGHLSFQYKERTGRTTEWVIEVREAYEDDGVLFIEGVCTTTDRKKTFRADRVAGPVKDMSSGRQGRMEAFFADADEW